MKNIQFDTQKFWRGFGLLIAIMLTCGAPAAEPGVTPKPISLLRRLGDLHHPVTTTQQMAQRFFDQGLTFVFGFNHDAAIRSFRRALEYDPNLAMAYWGIGLALGPNINLPVSPEAEKAAFEAVQQALALAGGCTQHERDYIQALSVRYSVEPGADLVALDRKYSEEMGRVADRYPDDLDAAVLHAEALMDLRPWQYWSAEGEPAEGTLRIVEILESVLRRNPDHPGANHYYIHAVEASRHPERALPSAARLEHWAPGAGHLVHMPSHVYLRTGEYAEAARINEKASEVDLDYIQACGITGVYPAMYTSHNLHFAAVAHLLQGRYAAARRYAERLRDHVQPMMEQIPDLEPFLPTLEQVLVSFGKWSEILALPRPAEKHRLHRALWHFARGIALASTARTEEAARELSDLRALRAEVPPETRFGQFNLAADIFEICEKQVSARIALAQGQAGVAAELLRSVLPVEDNLRYMEPPDWYLYTREALGGVLLTGGQFPEAEKVFRQSLERNRRQGRALYGLRTALEQQGQPRPARLVAQGMEKAWENADVELSPDLIWWDGVRR